MKTSHAPGSFTLCDCPAPDGLGRAISVGAIQKGEEHAREIAIVVPHEDMEANARLFAAAPELLTALIAISTNPCLNLEDRIYDVREREGQGWDGPAVKQWGDACQLVKSAIAKAQKS
jgi:hypothetical protein